MQPYTRITTWEERRAPEGKYRVMLNDRGKDPALYYVGDFDTAEEAFVVAEFLDKRNQNGIVQGSLKKWVLYPDFESHQLHTRESLLKSYGQPRLSKVTGRVLERALTDANIDTIEEKQAERIPGWQPGHRLVVFWRDIADATGAVARPGDLGY